MIVGFTPGDSTDVTARILARALSQQLGQPVIVEIKAGASGNNATEYVASPPREGYTITLCTIPTHAINPHLFRNPPYGKRPVRTALTVRLEATAGGPSKCCAVAGES